MGVQERRARQKEELRQEILDAARELFARQGYENVSMRGIAEMIEYSPTTIYLYFQDKADLFDCVCEETLAKLGRKLTSLDGQSADPVEGLKKGLHAYVEFGLKYPNDYRVSFLSDVKPIEQPERFSRCREQGQKVFDHLRGSVRACVEAGAFRDVEIEATSQILWAAIHGITSLFILRPRFPWVDKDVLVTTLIDTTVAGLAAPVAAGMLTV
jgi:AcrR family transcriptional regulator